MDEKALRDEIERDLRRAPSQIVIYLEGKTDPSALFALLGRPTSLDGLHRGVLVKGLSNKGSGATAVKARVEVATRLPRAGIVGVIDGDGEPHRRLASNFDPPYVGPLFQWKAYCIESLLAKTGWPPGWGAIIDWQAELLKYAPYAALNRIHRELKAALQTLDLAQFSEPTQGRPLKSPPDVLAALEADKHRLQGYDVAQRFQAELSSIQATIQSDLDEAHACLNGKWLFKHMAPSITGQTPERCRSEWIVHAESVGGLPEVREWWERVTGSPP